MRHARLAARLEGRAARAHDGLPADRSSHPMQSLPILRAGLLALPLLLPAGCDGAAETTDSAVQQASAGAGLVVVDPQFPDVPDEIDLGHVSFGDTLRRTVRLRNDSPRPLTIRKVSPGCSCTTPELSYTDPGSGELVRGNTRGPGDVLTLPPGVVAEMVLSVDSTVAPSKNAHKLIVLRITTDSDVTPYLTFNVRIFVESFFRPSPAVVDLKQVPINGGGDGSIDLAPDSLDGRRILSVSKSPLELVPELVESPVFGAQVWKLNVRLLPPIELGHREYTVELATSGPGGEGEGPPLVVRVRAMGVPDSALEPAVLLLDHVAPGARATAQARLIARLQGHALKITSARVEGELAGKLEVEIAPTQPDAEGRASLWDLRMVALEELGSAPLSGLLVVETADPEQPRFESRIVYRP
jgi:hypothetical protein